LNERRLIMDTVYEKLSNFFSFLFSLLMVLFVPVLVVALVLIKFSVGLVIFLITNISHLMRLGLEYFCKFLGYAIVELWNVLKERFQRLSGEAQAA